MKTIFYRIIIFFKIAVDGIFLLIILLLVSCGLINNKQPEKIQNNDTITLTINDKKLSVELAKTISQQMKGLMNKKSLPENSGMLFTYPIELNLSFWMKNTYIPLSIAFISEQGIIKEIYDMKPLDETPIRSINKVKYALEVNQGWFKKNNIEINDKIAEIN